MKFRFDHTYSADQNFKFRKKLGRAGFYLDDRKIEHPGKNFCQFIMMPLVNNRKQYLEFIHVGAGGINGNQSGFSLAAMKRLEPIFKKLNKRILCKYEHKNYDWKKNKVDRLPGWNFVTFPKHKSKIFTWITEYEASKGRKKQKKSVSEHPNEVYKISEFNMNLSPRDIQLYETLFGRAVNKQFFLPEKRIINFSKSKISRIVSIVMNTKNLKNLVQNYNWDKLIIYKEQPAVVIRNPNPIMWDVLILER